MRALALFGAVLALARCGGRTERSLDFASAGTTSNAYGGAPIVTDGGSVFVSGGSFMNGGSFANGGATLTAAGAEDSGSGGAAEAGAAGESSGLARPIGLQLGSPAIYVAVSGERAAITHADGPVEVVDIASGDSLQIMYKEGAEHPVGFDGNWVSSITLGLPGDGRILAQRVGDMQRQLLPTPHVRAFMVPSVDAGRIAFEGQSDAGPRAIWLFELGTQKLTQLTQPPAGVSDTFPVLSGDWVVFARNLPTEPCDGWGPCCDGMLCNIGQGQGAVYAHNVKNGRELLLSEGLPGDHQYPTTDGHRAVWPRGSLLSATSAELDLLAYDLDRGREEVFPHFNNDVVSNAAEGSAPGTWVRGYWARPSISGNRICFTNLAGELFVEEVATHHTMHFSDAASEPASVCSISDSHVAWIGGQTKSTQVTFVRDLP